MVVQTRGNVVACVDRLCAIDDSLDSFEIPRDVCRDLRRVMYSLVEENFNSGELQSRDMYLELLDCRFYAKYPELYASHCASIFIREDRNASELHDDAPDEFSESDVECDCIASQPDTEPECKEDDIDHDFCVFHDMLCISCGNMEHLPFIKMDGVWLKLKDGAPPYAPCEKDTLPKMLMQ